MSPAFVCLTIPDSYNRNQLGCCSGRHELQKKVLDLSSVNEPWTPSSWRSKPMEQVPAYPDLATLQEVEMRLSKALPLVHYEEVDDLNRRLSDVCRGKGFLLQGGDCAESFREFDEAGGENVRNTVQVLIQMARVLTYSLGVPVVPVGRIGGQFAKPRSEESETRGGTCLPAYRGDMINGAEFTEEARQPDPRRMIRAYNQSVATVNLIRSLTKGGYFGLTCPEQANFEFVERTYEGQRYRRLITMIERAISFIRSVGIPTTTPQLREVDLFTSHEALLLNYEECLTRPHEASGKYYDLSAHMLWVGDRTRQPRGAHLEFLRGIQNPVGIKAGPSLSCEDLLVLLDILNPQNTPGKITVVTRTGAGEVERHLPSWIKAVAREGKHVIWCCDPMHGNTQRTCHGLKTRSFDDVWLELQRTFEVHQALGSFPGGVHLELTGKNVTECTGGLCNVMEHEVPNRYSTHCDPRLNPVQSLEVAFRLAELLGSVA
eukprot:Rmarinus@m.133